MKKLITAFVALLAGVSVAAATDLPSRKAAPAPAVSTSVVNPMGFYVGGFVGGNFVNYDSYSWNSTPIFVGGLFGYEWNKFLRTEVTFDYSTKAAPTTTKAGQTLFGNAVVQYPIGFGITPYFLGGVGYGWGSWDNVGENSMDRVLYNVGGGVRYDLTKSFEIDGRYRYINAAQGPKFDNNHVVTLGVNYKF